MLKTHSVLNRSTKMYCTKVHQGPKRNVLNDDELFSTFTLIFDYRLLHHLLPEDGQLKNNEDNAAKKNDA